MRKYLALVFMLVWTFLLVMGAASLSKGISNNRTFSIGPNTLVFVGSKDLITSENRTPIYFKSEENFVLVNQETEAVLSPTKQELLPGETEDTFLLGGVVFAIPEEEYCLGFGDDVMAFSLEDTTITKEFTDEAKFVLILFIVVCSILIEVLGFLFASNIYK